jgi:hypothetical protein
MKLLYFFYFYFLLSISSLKTNLNSILKSSSEWVKNFWSYMQKNCENNELNDKARQLLIESIVNHFVQDTKKMDRSICEKLAEQIEEKFPNETKVMFSKQLGHLYSPCLPILPQHPVSFCIKSFSRFKEQNCIPRIL